VSSTEHSRHSPDPAPDPTAIDAPVDTPADAPPSTPASPTLDGANPPPGLLQRIGPTGLLAAVWLLLPPLGTIVLFLFANDLASYLRSSDFGLPLYIAGFAVFAGLGMLPTYAQSGLGGYIFGAALGAPAAVLGFGGAAVIGYEIARRTSSQRIITLIDEKPRWRAVRDVFVADERAAMHGLIRRPSFWRTLAMVILFRLPPNSPFALMNLVMASVQVPRAPYALGTMIGMAPRSTLAVFIGAGINQALTREALDEALPRWFWWVGILITLVIVVIIGLIANWAIRRVTGHGPGATPSIPAAHASMTTGSPAARIDPH
jgi:uncharacterized membrane protein YdjX (TVP38/TMEM64 family)